MLLVSFIFNSYLTNSGLWWNILSTFVKCCISALLMFNYTWAELRNFKTESPFFFSFLSFCLTLLEGCEFGLCLVSLKNIGNKKWNIVLWANWFQFCYLIADAVPLKDLILILVLTAVQRIKSLLHIVIKLCVVTLEFLYFFCTYTNYIFFSKGLFQIISY